MDPAAQVQSLLQQLAATQHHRATLPAAAAAEARALSARAAAAAATRAAATEASRARVEALLAGVPAPLLALAGARAALQLTADQRLALEVHLLAAEEAELQRAVGALEAEAAGLEARERAALASLEALPSELQRLQQQVADARSADDLEVLASESIVESSLRAVREASQGEMERVLDSWDALEGEARAAAQAEVAAELQGTAAACEAQLAAYSEGARARAKAAAEALADGASAEFQGALAPLLARLREGQAASAARAAHLEGVRGHCEAVLRDLRCGLACGEDVGCYAETFPACLLEGSAGEGAGAGAGAGVGEGRAALGDPLAACEARDARALGFSVEVARGEFSGLLDGVLSEWAGSAGGQGAGEAGAFLRELLAVLASGCEPGGGEGGGADGGEGGGRGSGLDIVGEVRAEAARLLQQQPAR